ncbi:RNA-binding protein 1-like [Phragmites australis]|uniref:RNA-binding protein 1-like n=1 Tax=Phragmites australis TaxID=29695 RepID=UPI002D7A0C70|nr:RNA-binding protein 1-like [Phragmites australis]
MAAENYWRYADARQQQQAMVAAAAAAAGMGPSQTVNTAQTVAAAAGMAQQAAAMAQQAAAPSLKRARPDFGDVSTGQDMTGYYPRETDRAGYHSLRENEAIGASYDRYLRNGMPTVGANDTSRAVVGGMAGAMSGGMAGYPVDDRRMMGVVGMDSRGMGYGARPEPPLPPDASSTLYIEGLPADCTRREVSHIFRPFVGFREVRLVNKESRHPGGDPHVLCFVDFDNPAQATIGLEALQGYKFDEHERDSAHLRLQFSRFPGPRSAGGPRGRR